MERPSLLSYDDSFRRLERDAAQERSQEVAITDDPEVIRQWAARHGSVVQPTPVLHSRRSQMLDPALC